MTKAIIERGDFISAGISHLQGFLFSADTFLPPALAILAVSKI